MKNETMSNVKFTFSSILVMSCPLCYWHASCQFSLPASIVIYRHNVRSGMFQCIFYLYVFCVLRTFQVSWVWYQRLQIGHRSCDQRNSGVRRICVYKELRQGGKLRSHEYVDVLCGNEKSTNVKGKRTHKFEACGYVAMNTMRYMLV